MGIRGPVEGLLWTGGPQVDPGWQGHLYCPIYNLGGREVVVPHKERFFTMDFARTTPFHETSASYGYSSKSHHGARNKSLQGHDQGRLRSAPFESLKQLDSIDTKTSGLDSRISNFSSLIFLVLNQSQGGMCMSGVLRVGVGVPRQGAGP